MLNKIYKLLFILIVAILGSISALWYANRAVLNAVDGKVFSQISTVPNKSVGLLLGTSQKLSDGRSNLYFSYRIDAAAELMKAGKIKYLIISGDNGNANYDEPTDMKNELIRLGIDSSKLYLDYAGFRTYDSIVRAKEIFGQEDLLIISQKFHNERAIYIADRLGMKAVGYNAKDVSIHYGFKTSVREKFARVKMLLDFMIGVEPKFLGEKIVIG